MRRARSRTAHEKLKDKRIINLDIPDIHEFMEPGWIELVRTKLKGLD